MPNTASPLLRTFVRLTLIIAAVLVGLWILHIVIPLLLTAAVVAALVIGGLYLYNLIRRGQTPA